METIIVRVSNTERFQSLCFGADDLLHHFPKLLGQGVECRRHDNMWYIIDESTGKLAGDCAFFSDEELESMDVVNTKK